MFNVNVIFSRSAYLPGVRVIITNKPEKEEPTDEPAGDREGSDSPADNQGHLVYNRSTIEELSHEDSIMDNDKLNIGMLCY